MWRWPSLLAFSIQSVTLMLSEHIATSNAKEGGECWDCDMAIGMHQRIYKYAVDGGTTAAGNGPGVWVCAWCHQRIQNRLDEIPEVDLWECAVCLKMSNPVVMVENRMLCFKCYGSLSAESGRLV